MVTKQKDAFMKNVTYRKHTNVHNICKSTKKKKFANENYDGALFLYSLCKKAREKKALWSSSLFFR